MKVLVTGATGEVAKGVIPELERQFDLRFLDLDPGMDSRFVQADIRRLDARLISAFQGMDAVIHMAVATGHTGTYEDDGFNDLRFDVNVKGTWHVFEAARRAHITRVVHTSSLMTVWGYLHPDHPAHQSEQPGAVVAGDAPARPMGTYALTKALSEEIAEYYARRYKMEVVSLRIAAPIDTGRKSDHTEVVRPQRVPFSELAEVYQSALRVPLDEYRVVTVVGKDASHIWDTQAAQETLKYFPQWSHRAHGSTVGDLFSDVVAE
ncbi:MAG: NAD(P)-dependent oxidoreductase [Planctomycetota bacterium]|nr:NAD(P)-dependent oxidoreductase [Planctomycetota bacterium]